MATPGYGTILAREDQPPLGVFTDVAEITNVGGPSFARDAIDVTHMESPARWREFIGGLRDGGEVSLDIQYVPDNATHQSLIQDDFQSQASVQYRITFTDTAASTIIFDALITGFEPSAPVDGKVEASLTLKITGAVTGTAIV